MMSEASNSNTGRLTGALPKSGNLCHNLGVSAHAHYEPPQANPLWQDALHLAETAAGNDPLQSAQFLEQLAQLYEAHGDQAKAARLYERLARVLEAALTQPGAPQPATNHWCLHTWRRLAALQQTQGRLAEAEAWLRRALTLAATAFRNCSPETGAVHHRLAGLLQAQQRLDEAAAHYEEALAINETLFGEEHGSVIELCRDLSRLELARGRWAEAEHFAQRALALSERALGAHHPALVPDLKLLAALQENLQRFPAAAQLYRRALAIVEQRYGPEHYEMAVLWQTLAHLSGVAEAAEAERCYLRALAIKEKLLGVQNLEVAELLAALAQFYQTQTRTQEAALYQQRADRIFGRMREDE